MQKISSTKMSGLRSIFMVTSLLSIISLLVMILIIPHPTQIRNISKDDIFHGMNWRINDDLDKELTNKYVAHLSENTNTMIDSKRDDDSVGARQVIQELDPSISDLALQISRAKKILKKVKIACFITTQEAMVKTKLAAVNNTWAPRIDRIFYLMTVNKTSNISFPNILSVTITNDRQHLTEKTVYAFKYLYDNHLNDFEWFLKADDDSYIIVENLKFMLSRYNSSKPIYIGHHFKHYSLNGYMSGGGSYVLSREALRLLVENGYNIPGRCRQNGGAEDIETGRCLTKAGAQVYNSRDKHNRETFHPMNAYGYIIGPLPRWVTGYDRNEAKTGNDCCSQLTISFHYTGPKLMAILDFLLYRTSVYGRQLDYERLKNFFKSETVPPPPPKVRIMTYFKETRDDYKNVTAWKLRNNTVL